MGLDISFDQEHSKNMLKQYLHLAADFALPMKARLPSVESMHAHLVLGPSAVALCLNWRSYSIHPSPSNSSYALILMV